MAPVAGGRALAAYSCGGSRGIGGNPHRVPFYVPPHAGTVDAGDYSRPVVRGKGKTRRALTKAAWAALSASVIDGLSDERNRERGTGFAQSRGCPRNCKRRALCQTATGMDPREGGEG